VSQKQDPTGITSVFDRFRSKTSKYYTLQLFHQPRIHCSSVCLWKIGTYILNFRMIISLSLYGVILPFQRSVNQNTATRCYIVISPWLLGIQPWPLGANPWLYSVKHNSRWGKLPNSDDSTNQSVYLPKLVRLPNIGNVINDFTCFW